MMETIWSKDGTIEQGNQEARNMIAAEEATCQEFPISCQERDGVWGIWFGLGEIVILFNPIDLVNSIYKDDIFWDGKITIMNNRERLLKEAEPLLAELDSVDSERFEKNIKAFIKECPDDGMLSESHISWDENNREFDILWDTSNLDMRFSIGIDEVTWHIWSGVNHHSKDDETYENGVGGYDINGEKPFAYMFFDNLVCYWKYHKEYWSPYQE